MNSEKSFSKSTISVLNNKEFRAYANDRTADIYQEDKTGDIIITEVVVRRFKNAEDALDFVRGKNSGTEYL